MNASSTTTLRRAHAAKDLCPIRLEPQRDFERQGMGRTLGLALTWAVGIAFVFVGWARLTEALDDPLMAVILLAIPALVLAPLLGGRRY